jgi:membrane protein YqaA with SNARE-associated domain
MMIRKKLIKALRFVSALAILIVLAFVVYGIANLGPMGEETSIIINNYGTPALFAISFFLDLVPQMISPIVALGAGLLAGINIYYAITAVVLGSAIGSIIGFAIGKKYMFTAVNLLNTKKSINTLTRLTNKYGKIAVPIAAVSPVPYLPVALGAVNFSTKNFIIFGLIPRAIGITMFGLLFSLL